MEHKSLKLEKLCTCKRNAASQGDGEGGGGRKKRKSSEEGGEEGGGEADGRGGSERGSTGV